jgi:excisionase family DNA binding protein
VKTLNKQQLSVRDVAEEYAVKQETVLSWIKCGALRALDVRSAGSTRPRWRIRRADLEAFFEARRLMPEPKGERRRTHTAEPDFVRYFSGGGPTV